MEDGRHLWRLAPGLPGLSFPFNLSLGVDNVPDVSLAALDRTQQPMLVGHVAKHFQWGLAKLMHSVQPGGAWGIRSLNYSCLSLATVQVHGYDPQIDVQLNDFRKQDRSKKPSSSSDAVSDAFASMFGSRGRGSGRSRRSARGRGPGRGGACAAPSTSPDPIADAIAEGDTSENDFDLQGELERQLEEDSDVNFDILAQGQGGNPGPGGTPGQGGDPGPGGSASSGGSSGSNQIPIPVLNQNTQEFIDPITNKPVGRLTAWGLNLQNMSCHCKLHKGCKFVTTVKRLPNKLAFEQWLALGQKSQMTPVEHRAKWQLLTAEEHRYM